MSVLRMSPEQYAEHLVRTRASRASEVSTPTSKAASVTTALSVEDARLLKGAKAKQKLFALGRLPKDEMNRTETAFAALLGEWMRLGKIVWWAFHVIKVRLGELAWYEPDFLVMHADRTLWIYETKGGFTTDKGQLKIRACANVLPVIGIIKATERAKKAGGGFELQDFSS